MPVPQAANRNRPATMAEVAARRFFDLSPPKPRNPKPATASDSITGPMPENNEADEALVLTVNFAVALALAAGVTELG